MSPIEVATLFGRSLDQDNFKLTAAVIHPECRYDMGSEVLVGAQAICDSYEQNMIEGRNKLDELVWGECKIVSRSNQSFEVHFTDYLKHAGQSHVHRCMQLLEIDQDGLITSIIHHDLPGEVKALKEFYQRTGVKSKR